MLKKKIGDSNNRTIADFLPAIGIKAKDFAAEMTSLNVQSTDPKGHKPIESEHVGNVAKVREMLLERGIQPENLAGEGDIKQLQRKLESEEKQVLKDEKKNTKNKKK